MDPYLPPPPPDPIVDRLTTWWGAALATLLLLVLAALCLVNEPWALPVPLTGASITFGQLVRLARQAQPHVPFGSTA